ncbi:hypothetical protein BEL04_10805 [Mucilaginibacter sp. PPCGB 2223]|uniref:hypothetical protein n=1 Tax=Mucilaginibacter sp. PPCGB 2223 TaxID=1886027 RepID=UPI000826570A|nr:hypothetical protein [Mucilaginibacter sp. PPCGB 2223]OCX54705.1 hypothetical protein BEL04_10805 [Mucilaginibacter sp. PPCGB 2223]
MTQLSNFIPISRKLFKHGFWLEQRTYSRFEAWLDMIALARYDDAEMKTVINNRLISYGRAELAASLRFLGARWGWSVTKVKNFLDMLCAEEMISLRTAEKTQQTIIRICKYDTYNAVYQTPQQQVKQPDNSKATAKKQQGNKTNKVNNGNKVNKDNSNIYRAFGHLSIRVTEFEQLVNSGHSPQQVNNVLDAIQNYKPNKNYTSLYLTAKNWLARPLQNFKQQNAAPKPGRINNIAGVFEQALNMAPLKPSPEGRA